MLDVSDLCFSQVVIFFHSRYFLKWNPGLPLPTSCYKKAPARPKDSGTRQVSSTADMGLSWPSYNPCSFIGMYIFQQTWAVHCMTAAASLRSRICTLEKKRRTREGGLKFDILFPVHALLGSVILGKPQSFLSLGRRDFSDTKHIPLPCQGWETEHLKASLKTSGENWRRLSSSEHLLLFQRTQVCF